VALARSLFRQGASFTAALAFEIASTNLVVELGIILALLIGWQFTLAARGRAGSMEGHATGHPLASELTGPLYYGTKDDAVHPGYPLHHSGRRRVPH
jgi:Predicted permease